MQNTKIVFISAKGTPRTELEVSQHFGDLAITISHQQSEQWQTIVLNKPTAVKLVKVLKSEIAKLEVNHE